MANPKIIMQEAAISIWKKSDQTACIKFTEGTHRNTPRCSYYLKDHTVFFNFSQVRRWYFSLKRINPNLNLSIISKIIIAHELGHSIDSSLSKRAAQIKFFADSHDTMSQEGKEKKSARNLKKIYNLKIKSENIAWNLALMFIDWNNEYDLIKNEALLSYRNRYKQLLKLNPYLVRFLSFQEFFKNEFGFNIRIKNTTDNYKEIYLNETNEVVFFSLALASEYNNHRYLKIEEFITLKALFSKYQNLEMVQPIANQYISSTKLKKFIT